MHLSDFTIIKVTRERERHPNGFINEKQKRMAIDAAKVPV
jgi:hypothetical protein